MRNHSRRPVVLICLSVSLIFFCSCTDEISWQVEQDDQGVLVTEGHEKVLFFQKATKSKDGQYARSNYIHPLYGIEGSVLTEDFPEDHLHHRGVFWTWHQVSIGEKRIGDAWLTEDFEWKVNEVKSIEENNFLLLKTDVDWVSPDWTNEAGMKVPFVKEKALIRIHPKKENFRCLDFEIEIKSLVDSLSIGGSEDEKGYGGFSWRMPLSDDVKFSGPDGQLKAQKLALDAGPWMNVTGTLNDTSDQEGIVVISQKDNPNHPQPWILRNKNSMQNAVYPGRYPVSISKDNPLKLRYRLITYKGKLSAAEIDKLSDF
ncbi:MAG: PmoA family protein [Cyclobacteriaceae bacterium]